MKKKITAFMLAILMPLVMILSLWVPTDASRVQAAAGTTFIVHYGERADNSYDGWNVWVWEEGFDGQSVAFTAEDDFGKIAVYQCTEDTERIGFIVRLNEWEAKDIESDRYADINGSVVEIWVTSGQEDFATEAPDGYESFDFSLAEEDRLGAYDKEEALKINLHYYNYAETYDTVESYVAIGDKVGGAYPLVQTDEYGALFHAGFLDYEEEKAATFKIYDGGASDTDTSRAIDLTQAKDGVIDAYTVQGNSTVWYSEADVDKTPVIVSAGFEETTKKILIKASKPIDTTDAEAEGAFFTVTDQDGNSYDIVKAWSENGGLVTEAYIIMQEPLDAANTYFIEREGYEGCKVAIKGAFSSESFEENYTYDGDDLGATYTKEKTSLRLWAPTASEVSVNLYEKGDGDCLIETVPMEKDVKGTWVCSLDGDQNGVYYTYLVTVEGETKEAVDPYARTTGVNGNRGMILDLDSTDPEDWNADKHVTTENNTDAIIYETHIRDITVDASSGIENAGKFLGLTETGTTSPDGIATGLDHIIDLGVTHVQIMPMYDFATVDEADTTSNQYNWGYDPKNYNVPEGSYSTDPFNGEVRVEEAKEMIQTLHDNNLGVIMDVVYNHMYSAEESCLDKVVPDYYFRMDGDAYTNGSGCGNETASERSMMRKYIVDSVVYWATEYHVDGFRFDLMGCIDQETMMAIRAALDEIDPNLIVLGEGWTGGTSGLLANDQTNKRTIYKVEGVAAFSDDIRDAIKGSVFDNLDTGFVTGKADQEVGIEYGVAAATQHPEIDYSKYEKTTGTWAGNPNQCISYVSCHDNLTLWDKLYYSAPDATHEERVSMDKLSQAIVFTSQGVPFILCGEEILRSKPIEGDDANFSSNSYNLPDYTNAMRWDSLNDEITADVYEYYKGLIAFRKAHGGLRMNTTEEVQENLHFIETEYDNVVAYTIDNSPNSETAESIMVIYNANPDAVEITLPEGKWNVCINGESAGTETISTVTGTVNVDGISAYVLVKDGVNVMTVVICIAVVVVIIAGIAVAVILAKKRKKKKVTDK